MISVVDRHRTMSRIDAPSMSIGEVTLHSPVPQTICLLKLREFLVRAVTHLAMATQSALFAVSSKGLWFLLPWKFSSVGVVILVSMVTSGVSCSFLESFIRMSQSHLDGEAVCGGARLVAGPPRLLQLPDRAAHEGLENEFYFLIFWLSGILTAITSPDVMSTRHCNLVQLRWYSACTAPFLAGMNGFCLPRPKVLLGHEWFSVPTS